MDLGLREKHAVVLASSKGLGFATAKRLAQEGANVTICSSSNANIQLALNNLHKEQLEGKIHGIVADISKTKDIERLFAESEAQFGTIDILVTNSGGPKVGTFDEVSNSEWKAAFNDIFISAIGSIRRVLPAMKKQNWGSIVAITSVTVKNPIANLILSNGIRAALNSVLKTIADDVARYNITINNICPGLIHTGRVDHLFNSEAQRQNRSFAEIQEEITEKIPMSRLGSPDEFASYVAFLCSEQARYITGETHAIDGGVQRGPL